MPPEILRSCVQSPQRTTYYEEYIMQRDNRTQSPDTQRNDSPPRAREDSPTSRQGSIDERTASTQRGQPAPSGGARQQPSDASQGSRRYGVVPRSQSFGLPSMFSGGGPFALMRQMEQEMDRMFEQVGFGGQRGLTQPRGPGAGSGLPSLWQPQVEMFERDGKLHVCSDLPGLSKEDVHINVENDMVTIQGERRSSHEDRDQQRGFFRSERSYGSFYRTIPLPEGVNAESGEATFRDGVLDITFDAPNEQPRGRRLEIRDSSSQQAQSQSGTGATGGTTQR
jgi:HSP20 family protein